MAHRRRVGSRRKFADGMYRLQYSASGLGELNSRIAVYQKFLKPGEKIRYLRGEDYMYHIYIKIVESTP